MFFAMLLCTLVFVSFALFKNSPKKLLSFGGKRYAALSGLANGAASFLTLMLASYENASVLFPILSASTILGALLCGRFLFKERLLPFHYAAILLGITAVIFLKL